MNDVVEVGFVARPHGVRGELRVILHNPESEILGEVERVYLAGRECQVVAARPTKDAVLLRVREVPDRNAAEPLRGAPVAVARDDIELEDGEVLLADLVGLQVERTDGSAWGVVAAVVPGTQDRLVIHDGELERELPAVDAFLVEVDLEGGRLVVDPPEDLPEWPRPER